MQCPTLFLQTLHLPPAACSKGCQQTAHSCPFIQRPLLADGSYLALEMTASHPTHIPGVGYKTSPLTQGRYSSVWFVSQSPSWIWPKLEFFTWDHILAGISSSCPFFTHSFRVSTSIINGIHIYDCLRLCSWGIWFQTGTLS